MPRNNQPTAAGVSALLAVSNSLLGGIEDGVSRAELWGIAQAAAAEAGSDLGGATIFDMNYVYSKLSAVNQAQIAFDNALPNYAIEGNQWAWAPWSGPDSATFATESYQLRFSYQVQLPDGTQSTIWGQTDWQGSLDFNDSGVPLTKQDILDRALGSAQMSLNTGSPGALNQLGGLTGGVVSGIGQLQILRV